MRIPGTAKKYVKYEKEVMPYECLKTSKSLSSARLGSYCDQIAFEFPIHHQGRSLLMVSYRSLRHIGLMMVVATAAIMAAGVVWAATLTCIPTAGSFNTANCPTGSCHLASGVVNCVFDTTAQTVTCSEPCDI